MRGVYPQKRAGGKEVYSVIVRYQKKNHDLGTYLTRQEAAYARDVFVILMVRTLPSNTHAHCKTGTCQDAPCK